MSDNRDSQTAWSICQLMRTLANNGQAVLCTIHQPSAVLMQEFDRLLFLETGGRTVYFGDIGENCNTLTSYFETHGAHPCPPHANPAEWMLEIIGAAPGHYSTIDWFDVWRKSDEYHLVRKALKEMERQLPTEDDDHESPVGSGEFAMSLSLQLWYCLKRVWEQYWRTPSYIYSKAALCTLTVRINHQAVIKSTYPDFIRRSSLVSLSTKRTTASRDCRTRCFPFSCSSLCLATLRSKLCRFSLINARSMRPVKGPRKLILGKPSLELRFSLSCHGKLSCRCLRSSHGIIPSVYIATRYLPAPSPSAEGLCSCSSGHSICSRRHSHIW